MACCHHYIPVEGNEAAVTAAMPAVTFGRGVLAELGERARLRGLGRVALFTDETLAGMAPVETARQAKVSQARTAPSRISGPAGRRRFVATTASVDSPAVLRSLPRKGSSQMQRRQK